MKYKGRKNAFQDFGESAAVDLCEDVDVEAKV